MSLASLAGPDSLTALRFWLAEAAWPKVELRLNFDGSRRVRLPFSDFFAIGRGGSEGTRSLLLGTAEDGGLYSYFPMPFFEHAEISIRNLAAAGSVPVSIAYELRHSNQEPSPESALFGAQRWVDNETPIGVDIPLLRLQGEGKWVGLFSDLGSVNTASRGYLEGDERVFLDASLHPEVYGTGTEDFYNGGFYFDQGPFRRALHGSPYHYFLENGEDVTAAYRLMLTDGISFARSLRAGLEGGRTSNVSLRSRSVAYYYLRTTPGMWRSDVLDLGDPESRANHLYTVPVPHEFLPLDGLFEGEPAMALEATGVYRPPGEAQFRLRAIPGATRMRLRRRLDADHAGQEAEIWVDGNLVGRFPPEDRNSDRRWREISIDLLPSSANKTGEYEFTITALARPGTTLPEDSTFTAFTYELWVGKSSRMFTDGLRPAGVMATDGSHADRVQVTWIAVAGATDYRVYRCLDRSNTCGSPLGSPTGTSFSDLLGTPEQVYYYRVRACTATTCSKFSVADSGYRPRPDIPTGVVASDGTYDDRVLITWDDVAGATIYRVFRCLDRGNSCGFPVGNPTGNHFNDRRGNPDRCITTVCGPAERQCAVSSALPTRATAVPYRPVFSP